MVKKIIACVLYFVLLFMLSVPVNIFAVGEGNLDGGGGGLGQGTDKNYWSNGDEGVRVTIVRDSDNSVAVAIDFTNKHPDNIKVHFGKTSKLQYISGLRLTPRASVYLYYNPSQALPKIISSNGNVNIDAIKRYFCSEYSIKLVADLTGVDYDSLTGGEYKLLLEPVAYITYNGLKMAMTAHEAALYDQQIGGNLRSKMGSLTHKNLPLAMFLEKSDLGFPAWDGPTNQKLSDSQIISSLGLGIVRFKDADAAPSIAGADYEYRVDTDVITAVTVTAGSRITPDNPATVTFDINGTKYRVTDIVIPEGNSQIVWVKWHTPVYPTTVVITASVDRGSVSRATITAKIVNLSEKIPPDPDATDIMPAGYTIPSLPDMSQKTAANWGVWGCHWEADWEWNSDWDWISDGKGGGHWVDNGEWADRGDWKYTYTSYTANLAAAISVTPDARVPTALGKTIKSGYGINLNIKTKLDSNAPSSAITGAQNVLSFYPEFNYKTYLRLSDLTVGGYNAEFELKPNAFSSYGRRVHFTPIWFPDGRYVPVANVIDVWTPDGMLSCCLNDYVDIKGSLYYDWHIAPKE